MEPSPEFSKERGIALVSLKDPLDMNLHGDEFKSKEKLVPNLGIAYLLGDRLDYDSEQLGVAIIGENVVIKSAGELSDMGFFEISLIVDSLRTQTACKIMLPKDELELEGVVEIEEDDLEEDPQLRYFGITDKWKMRGEDRKFLFFSPRDAKFLSQLRFTFEK